MSNKVNSSRFKLFVVEMVGTPTPVATDKLITEQMSMNISRSTNTIDVTSKDNAGYDEFIGGLKSGEVSCEIIMDLSVASDAAKVNYIDMSGYEASRTVKTFKAKLDDGQKTLSITFQALITKFDVGAPLEDKITCSMTMKRSGAPSETLTTNP
ncbi:phage tail tube protein [Spirosoma pollinicola]|uniref:Type VI secretion system needle protein Hcp n=1 Tax=Spirosoma pollinicola TaxID=2057025 RepID=A0A2K8ZAU6_9BACT|nr:phage tail tube protein [Spirosoma pollinicola]AUD07007.1 hypothetical protein CWM47_37420 [Spirosoma pollinicola]